MTHPLSKSLFARAAGIQLIVLDVDGVLTDGKITYDSTGAELKNFNVKDGLGISLAVRESIQLAIITARQSPILERRAQELGIQHLIQGTRTKLPAFQQLLESLNLKAEQAAYIGDDLPDLPPILACGLPCCPADAALMVRENAVLTSQYPGGGGAVREIIEFIIESRALLQGQILTSF